MKQCPVCEYYLEPHDEECPRCKRNAEAAATALDSAPTPGNAAPIPSAFACFYHPHLPAIGQCSECLRNCCKSCLKNVNGLLLCPEDAKTAGKREEAAVTLASRLFWYIIGAAIFIPVGLRIVNDMVYSAKHPEISLPPLMILIVLCPLAIAGYGMTSAVTIRKKISPAHPIQGKITFNIAVLVISVVLYFVLAGFVYANALLRP